MSGLLSGKGLRSRGFTRDLDEASCRLIVIMGPSGTMLVLEELHINLCNKATFING